jgi:DNA polymerase III subunit epsilon
MINNLKLEKPIAFFDIETTGTNRVTSRIVEIAIVKLNPDGTEEFKHKRINPSIPIPSRATAIHGIKDEDIKNEPNFLQYAKGICDFMDGCDLVGFNIEFDLQILEAEFKRANIPFSRDGRLLVDCLTIFRKKESHTLTSAYKKYCGKEINDAHSADSDTRATVEILEGQLNMYSDLPKDIKGLSSYCLQKDDDSIDSDGKFIWEDDKATFNFGKYKGRTLEEISKVDKNYFYWLMDNMGMSQESKNIVVNALKGVFPKKN